MNYQHLQPEEYTPRQAAFAREVRSFLPRWGLSSETPVAIFRALDPGALDACVLVVRSDRENVESIAYGVLVASGNLPSEVCEAGAEGLEDYLPYCESAEHPSLAAEVRAVFGVDLLDENNNPIGRP